MALYMCSYMVLFVELPNFPLPEAAALVRAFRAWLSEHSVHA